MSTPESSCRPGSGWAGLARPGGGETTVHPRPRALGGWEERLPCHSGQGDFCQSGNVLPGKQALLPDDAVSLSRAARGFPEGPLRPCPDQLQSISVSSGGWAGPTAPGSGPPAACCRAPFFWRQRAPSPGQRTGWPGRASSRTGGTTDLPGVPAEPCCCARAAWGTACGSSAPWACRAAGGGAGSGGATAPQGPSSLRSSWSQLPAPPGVPGSTWGGGHTPKGTFTL